MTAARAFTINDPYNEMNFYNVNSTQPPIRSRFDDQVHQRYQTSNGDRYRTSEPERSNWCTNCCSKQCVIGLCIGLAIGIVLVIAIAVPVGVIKTCDTSATTTYVPFTTISSSTASSSTTTGITSSIPKWNGTFLMDNGCDTTVCCCLFNRINLTQIIGNQIQITGRVTGQCAAVGSIVSLFASTPTGFQTGVFWGTQPIRLQLGQDSSYLAFINIGTAQAVCSATAIRIS